MKRFSVANHYRKAVRIAAQLRNRIVSGDYAPGARLPTRDEMTVQYGVCKVTVQRALEQLTHDGFVVADGRRGTFVAPDSPHLTRYLLLFPEAEKNVCRNQMWNALALEAQSWHARAMFDFFYGFAGREGIKQYQKVLDDVSCSRVAGLIFASPPYEHLGTPLIDQPGIPRTAVMSQPSMLGIPVVSHDRLSFFRKSLDMMARAGRRRPAIVVSAGLLKPHDAALAALLEERSMYVVTHGVQSLCVEDRDWCSELVRLLFDRPGSGRPDSLLICNDNFVEPATQALKSMALRVPDDVYIVAECNFPYPTPSCLPVNWVGFSAADCLRLCMHNIDLQRQGIVPPMQTFQPAVAEDETETMHEPGWLQNPYAVDSDELCLASCEL